MNWQIRLSSAKTTGSMGWLIKLFQFLWIWSACVVYCRLFLLRVSWCFALQEA
jgi:hypothetical protein